MPESIIIVDDDAVQSRLKQQLLSERFGYQTQIIQSENMLSSLRSGLHPTLIIMDIETLAVSGLGIVRYMQSACSDVPVIVLTRYGDNENAEAMIDAGAFECLAKPVSLGQLKRSIQHALKMRRMQQYIRWLERRFSGHVDCSDIVGESPLLKEAVATAKRAASTRNCVWLQGEEGTGRELLARAIHGSSDRAGRPFVVVHAAMLSPAMAETMLFGHDHGSDGYSPHMAVGKIREADQGTLLVKDAQALPQAVRHRLFKSVLPSPEHAMDVNVRLMVTAPCDHVRTATCESELRQPHKITLPRLRERREDIAALSRHFLTLHAAAENIFVRDFTPEAIKILTGYAWPGNVAQLGQMVQRACLLAEGEVIDAQVIRLLLPHGFGAEKSMPGKAMENAYAIVDEKGKIKPLKSVEREAICYALAQAKGCMSRAAKDLGIGRSTIYRKISEMGLEV